MNKTAITLIAALLWTAASAWAGWEWRDLSADLAVSEQQVEVATSAAQSEARVRETEQQHVAAMTKIGDEHEQDRQAAQAVDDAVVADLRSGNLKLRDDLASCHTAKLSESVAGSLERDESAQLRDTVAGNLVRVGRDADDQLRACQAVIRAVRQQETTK